MRVHRLTPLINALNTIVLVAVFVALNDGLRTMILDHLRQAWWIAAGSIAGVLLVVWVLSGIWWRALSFEIGEKIVLRSGVISKNVRSAHRSNVQAVDVDEPFLPRLFGLAELKIETAGGPDSNIVISYLPREEAARLREEILAHPDTNTAATDTPAPTPATPPITTDTRTPAIEVPELRALLAIPLRHAFLPVVAAASVIVVSLANGGVGVGAIVVLLGVAAGFFRRVDGAWRMTLTLGDSLRLTYGLANRSHTAIPLDRVHALQLRQPPLWRPFGWWEVTLAVAGFDEETTVLPVGTLAQARQLLGFLHADATTLPTLPSFRSPARARWLSPLAWKSQTVTVGENHVVLRRGWWGRRESILRREHIQVLAQTHGPVKRALGLANVRCGIVPSRVSSTALQLSAEDASHLVDQLRVGKHLPRA